MSGAFKASLKRNNKEIRGDRAEAISEDAELMFRRQVEDLQTQIKRKKRERDNLLDQSPSSAISLKLAEDFDADEFVETDLRLGLELRNLEIKLEIAQNRFNYLFVGAEGEE